MPIRGVLMFMYANILRRHTGLKMQQNINEGDIRNRIDHFVTTGGGRNLHLLHPESTLENPEPLCGYPYGQADPNWFAKSKDVFPSGFRPICQGCLGKFAANDTEG